MCKKKILNIIGTFLACTIILFSKPFTKWVTDGFTIHAIQSVFPSDPRWMCPYREDVEKILNQRFTYLNKGNQCYAFLSEDGQYILKFFNQRLYKRKGLEKRELDFASYKIAYDTLQEETGVIFLHLAPGKSIQQQVTIVDRLNIEHLIEVGNFEFLLQKRADLPMTLIAEKMKEHKKEEAEQIIDALFTITHTRLDKGILDRDPNMTKNLGLLEGKPLQIDIGGFFVANKPANFKEDLELFRKKSSGFGDWLQENYPPLYTRFLEQLALLEDHYSQKFAS